MHRTGSKGAQASFAQRYLARIVNIEPGEVKAVIAAFLLFFFVLGSYFAVRPARETIGTSSTSCWSRCSGASSLMFSSEQTGRLYRTAQLGSYRSRISRVGRSTASSDWVPAPGGRSSTLRCAWSADLAMDRIASSSRGMRTSRSFAKNDVANGSLPGWCTTNKSAIAGEVARKVVDANKHILEAAREDQSALLLELDRLVKSQNLSS